MLNGLNKQMKKISRDIFWLLKFQNFMKILGNLDEQIS